MYPKSTAAYIFVSKLNLNVCVFCTVILCRSLDYNFSAGSNTRTAPFLPPKHASLIFKATLHKLIFFSTREGDDDAQTQSEHGSVASLVLPLAAGAPHRPRPREAAGAAEGTPTAWSAAWKPYGCNL